MALRLTGPKPIGVVAVLSWFDEDPRLLRQMVASLPQIGVTTLVAVDGAYSLFECDDFRSPEAQHVALWEACAAAKIRLVSDLPSGAYRTEALKRERAFQLAESYAQTGDWLFWIDADETVARWMDLHRSLSDVLRSTSYDVGEITHYDRPLEDGSRWYCQYPRLFRAGRFSHMGPNHYTLIDRDGNALWGNAQTRQIAFREVLPLVLEHHHRPKDRQERSGRFYRARNQFAPEGELVDMETYTPGPWVGTYDVVTTAAD